MSTARLPLPSELKWELTARLPRWENEEARVFVTPCDKDGRRCAAWRADHYCIQAFYTPTAVPSLGPLEQALQVWPGVYRTTKVHVLLDDNGQMIGKTPLPVDRDWPDKKLITDPYLRPQVWALIRDDQNQLPFRRIGDGVYESKGYWATCVCRTNTASSGLIGGV